MSDVETFYCLIVGSRSFSDYELFVAKCDLLLRNWGSVVIVSGGARGAGALFSTGKVIQLCDFTKVTPSYCGMIVSR